LIDRREWRFVLEAGTPSGEIWEWEAQTFVDNSRVQFHRHRPMEDLIQKAGGIATCRCPGGGAVRGGRVLGVCHGEYSSLRSWWLGRFLESDQVGEGVVVGGGRKWVCFLGLWPMK
jgi:hypothetical protein